MKAARLLGDLPAATIEHIVEECSTRGARRRRRIFALWLLRVAEGLRRPDPGPDGGCRNP